MMRRALATVLVALACANRDIVATTAATDGTEYCQGTGPPILADGTCTGRLAEAAFGRAVCTCGSLGNFTALDTDGFDSRSAPWTPGAGGGDVGGNAGLDFGGTAKVAGALTIAGNVQAGTTLDVDGDLAIGGGLGRSSSAINVGGAARIGGNVDVAVLHVASTLTMPGGATYHGSITPLPLAGPVEGPPPGPCNAVSISTIVGEQRTANQDATIGLEPDALANLHDDATLQLPCGLFYLTRIQVSGASHLALRATGRTALFVAEDLTVDGALTLEIAPGAELDVFVAGSVNLPGTVRLGDATRPRALRLYLGAGGSISLSPGSRLAGNLYAPAADLAASAPLEIYGALLVNHLALGAGLTVHRDRATAAAGAACQN